MTRLLLTWIGVAALQLGMPRAVVAAELLRPVGEPTSVVPRPEAQSRGALTRHGFPTDADQGDPVTPGAPGEPPPEPLAFAHGASPTGAPHRAAPVSLARVLPDARAPPA
jgi:hypothetical protein